MTFYRNPWFWIRLLLSAALYVWLFPKIDWTAVKTAFASAKLGWIGLALALFWASLEVKKRGVASLNLKSDASVLRWHESLMAWLIALAAGFLNQPFNQYAGFPGWYYALGWAFVTALFVAGNRIFFRGKATPALLLLALTTQALQVSAGLCLMVAVGETTRPLEYAMLLAGAQVLAPLTLAGAGVREALFVLGFDYLPIEIGQGVAVSLLWLGLLGLSTGFQFRRGRQ